MHCRHAGVCGGCSLLHLSYSDQLSGKEASLRRLLGPFLPHSRQPLFLPVDSQPDPQHFRHKVAFVFAPGPSGRGLVMGHYQRGSRRVVAVEECPVHSARGNRIAFALRDHLQRSGISAAGPELEGLVRHLIVRTTFDEREAVAMLVVTRNDKRLRAPIRAFLESAERPEGFFVNIHAEDSSYMVGERTLKIEGAAHVREKTGDISYLISPTAFCQTNVAAATVLQSYVVDAVGGASRVLDLYCDSGLFSLPLAARGVRTLGVEENRQAVDDATLNAKLNRIPTSRARFITARVEDAVRSASRDPWDAVILDPPRQGCSDLVLEAVFQDMAPPRVIYVSCNPESLAAELPGMVQCGYVVEEVRAVDMFPHTEHVEAVVRLKLA